MPTFEISPDDIPEVLRAAIVDLETYVADALYMAAEECVTLAVAKSEEVKAVDRGMFINAWRAEPTPDGALVINDTPYADIIENGSRPHWPPLYPIMAYIARKKYGMGELPFAPPIGPWTYDLAGHPAMKDETINKIRLHALGIARSIAAHGTKPRHILAGLQNEFREAIDRNIQPFLDAGNAP